MAFNLILLIGPIQNGVDGVGMVLDSINRAKVSIASF